MNPFIILDYFHKLIVHTLSLFKSVGFFPPIKIISRIAVFITAFNFNFIHYKY